MVAAILYGILGALALAAIVAVAIAIRARLCAGRVVVRHSRATLNSIQNLDVSSASVDEASHAGAEPRVGGPPTPAGGSTDHLSSRFLALGALAATVFGALATRLFGMQVVSSEGYRRQANENKYIDVATPAPRGYIFDADGVALVKNRSSLTVVADAEVADDRDVLMRLSAVLGVPYSVVRARLADTSSGAQSQRVVDADVSLRNVAFITEHSDAFPGVTVQNRTIRSYPYGALAAHVLGYTGSVSADDLKEKPQNSQIELGDDVGKSGVEYVYDRVLAGEHGKRRVMADANGRVVRVVSETQPLRGSDLHLTLRASVQYTVDRTLADLIAPDGVIGTGTGVAGAVVVMDVRDGSIVAMGSYPTFAPETFTGGISQDVWDLYSSASSHHPLLNRATSGAYAAASTFKSFTGLAALRHGFADAGRTWTCTGSWDGFRSGDVQKCWLKSGHGTLNFEGGIIHSCDVVFYEIAYGFFFAGVSQGGRLSDTALQEEAIKYRFGQATGIDLPSEEKGRVPTPEWKAAYWADVPTEGVWRGGDLTNMVIGQGDVLVTPLQVAVAYGGIATGRLMKPHLLKEVRNGRNAAAVTFQPEVLAEPDVSDEHLSLVRRALNGVAPASPALSKAFREQGLDPTTIACKTGTAEMVETEDYAWFACYAPFDEPRYVVSVLVEEGGGGAATAGPIGAKVMAAALAADEGEPGKVGRVEGSTGESVRYVGARAGRTD
ncbi:penicillin-binding protein 2 [Eggerthellaceae bacterium zg-1084]|uniref:penicillin-binding protein 2 n=1 Tax=Berryella wangjianweii TaxID=2734634 RepID=UPI0015518529|nr:penicillin-binding protein 2 [Berryella wangjianweii]NPD30623.1 penicillin-binding protein 2 [Berryella wangjianweii]